MSFRVVASGVESLNYTAELAMNWRPSAPLGQLARLKEAAQLDGDTPQFLELGGRAYQVQPSGRPGFAFVLTGELCSIAISTAQNMRPQKVDLTAWANWTLTPAVAYQLSRLDLAELCDYSSDGWKADVSRIDLTVDVQGWTPPDDADPVPLRRRLVTRARNRDRFDDDWHCGCGEPWVRGARFCAFCAAPREAGAPGMAKNWKQRSYRLQGAQPGVDFVVGLQFSGAQWGARDAIFLRCYDKPLEIRTKSRSKMWFWDLWALSDGFVPGEPVIRWEFQVMREALTDMVAGGAPISTVEEALAAAPSLWRYLAGGRELECRACGAVGGPVAGDACAECGGELRTRSGWAELRMPERTRRTRWPLDPLWAELQKVYFEASGPALAIERRTRHLGDAQRLARQALGCLIGVAAQTDVLARLQRYHHVPPDELPAQVWRAMWKEMLSIVRADVAIENGRPKPGGERAKDFLRRVHERTAIVRTKG